ncbi:MAG TPA: hypothetical protein EYP86_05025 [Candidatus Altiarchaeales archaeon]|nr:hypothetical protein [Candidatus Altiarchaeales archaeon]
MNELSNGLENFYEDKGYIPFINARGWKGDPDRYTDTQAIIGIACVNAYRKTGTQEYLLCADRSARVLKDFYWDNELGGFYEMIGQYLEEGHRYKLSHSNLWAAWFLLEYYAITGDSKSRNMAISTLNLIEKYFYNDGRFMHSAYRNFELTGCGLGGCCGNDTFADGQSVGIIAYIRTYKILGDEKYRKTVISALNEFNNLKDGEGGFVHCTSRRDYEGKATWEQFSVVIPLLYGYEFTNDSRYLRMALDELSYIESEFSSTDSRLIINRILDYRDLRTQAYALWAYSLAIRYDDKYKNKFQSLLNETIEYHHNENGFWRDSKKFVKLSYDYGVLLMALSEFVDVNRTVEKENKILYGKYILILLVFLIIIVYVCHHVI